MIPLRDRLSHLTYRQASKLLGPEGEQLIRQGGKYDFNIEEQVAWGEDLLRINLGDALVTFSMRPERPRTLDFTCSKCTKACEHLGAAFSLILEEKLALGLSAPPPEKVPVESLSDKELVKRAIEERAERAKTEKMSLRPTDGHELWNGLYGDQSFFRKDLSRRSERMGEGRLVLFVSGFSKEHPGHL